MKEWVQVVYKRAIERKLCRYTDRQTDRQTGSQMDRQRMISMYMCRER